MFTYWLLAGFIGFCLGDFAGIYPEKGPPVAVGMLLLLVGSFFMLYRERKKSSFVPCIVLLCMALGGLWLSRQAQQPRQAWQSFTGRQIVLQGEAEPESIKRSEGGISAVFSAEAPLRGKVRIFIKTGDAGKTAKAPHLIMERERKEQLLLSKLRLTGVVEEAVYLENPGAYNGALKDRIEGIYGRMSLPVAQVQVTGEPLSFWRRPAALSQRIRALAEAHLRTGAGRLLPGILFGGYQGVEAEDADVFRNNGMAHLLAVSGTHVSLFTAFLWVLLRPLPSGLRYYGILFLLFLYAFFCGLRPAVLRSALMAAAFLWGRQQEERLSPFRLLLLTAWGMLVVRPLWLADISFQLSFVTVAGLLVAGKRVTKYLPDRCPDSLRSLLGISLTAQLAVLPFIVFYFHRIPVVSALSNLLLLPALGAAALLFLPGLFFLGLGCAAGQWFFTGAEFLLQGVMALGRLLEQLPFAVMDVADWGVARSLCYWGFLIGLLDLGPFLRLSGAWRDRWLQITGGLFVLLWLCPLLLPRPLTVYFMDVGQGDAALIRTPAGKHILIDTGGLQGKADIGRMVVVPYLRYLGVKELDALFLSHGDHDHAGGAAHVARQLPVKRLFLSPGAEASSDVRALLRVPEEKKRKAPFGFSFFSWQNAMRTEYLRQGDVRKIGDCRIVTAAAGGNGGLLPETGNEASLILQLFCDGHSLVFPGDAGMETEEASCRLLQRAEVLKVSHHGSDGSSSPFFLQQVRPSVSVISCGRKNRYGHPSAGALERLSETGGTVLRTDLLGSVKVELDKDGIRWYSYRYQPGRF